MKKLIVMVFTLVVVINISSILYADESGTESEQYYSNEISQEKLVGEDKIKVEADISEGVANGNEVLDQGIDKVNPIPLISKNSIMDMNEISNSIDTYSFPDLTDKVDKTGIIGEFEVGLFQDGILVPDGGTIDLTKDMSIKVIMNIPVLGDFIVPVPGEYVEFDNYLNSILINNVKLTEVFNPTMLSYNGVDIGTMFVENDTSTPTDLRTVIVFNGDTEVFDGTYSDVNINFTLGLELDDGNGNLPGSSGIISSIDKSYNYEIPEQEKVVSMEKSASRVGNEIVWTNQITKSEYEDGSSLDLSEHTFTDDLKNIGEYVPGTFEFSEDGVNFTPIEESEIIYDNMSGILSYELPSGTVANSTIRFNTTIADDVYYSNKEFTIENTSNITYQKKVLASAYVEFKDKIQWIDKKLVKNNGETQEWQIVFNEEEENLGDVVLEDIVKFVGYNPGEVEIESYNVARGSFSKVAYEENKLTNSILITDVRERITVTVVTKIKSYNANDWKKTIQNTALIKFKNYVATDTATTSTGISPIRKKAGIIDYQKYTTDWSISVDNKNNQLQDREVRVVDIMIHDAPLGSDEYILKDTNGAVVDDKLVLDIFENALPKQKSGLEYIQGSMVEQSSSGNIGVMENMYNIFDPSGSDYLGDLIIFSKSNGEPLDIEPNKSITFSYKTTLGNKSKLLDNSSHQIINTAQLFDGSKFGISNNASIIYKAPVLKKDTLERGEYKNVTKDDANSPASTPENAYNYNDNSIYYRMHINPNNLKVLNGEYKPVISDKLPEGWEFVAVNDENIEPLDEDKYLLFEGEIPTENNQTNVIASKELSITQSDIDVKFDNKDSEQRIEIEFENYDLPFMVILKVQPTKETLKEYFNSNEKIPIITNTAEFYVNAENTVNSSVDVVIENGLFSKTVDSSIDGELGWTINYQPHNVELIATHIEDEIPEGIELIVDSGGNLDYSKIQYNEMNLDNSGNYTIGMEVEDISEKISYNPLSRTLRAEIPDSKKSYSLTYKTILVGDYGMKVTNNARLIGEDVDGVDDDASYKITRADVSATVRTNGTLTVNKINEDLETLEGAKFVLFSRDENVVIRSGITDENGTLTLRGLVPGTYDLIETIPPPGYSADFTSYSILVEKNSENKVTVSVNGNPGVDEIDVTNFKSGDGGSISVQKVVTGIYGNQHKEFEFTIKIEDVVGEIPYLAAGGKNNGFLDFNERNEAIFTLKSGELIFIENLPENANYTVSEKDYENQGYISTSVGDSGQVSNSNSSVVSFINDKEKDALETTDLIVSKVFEGKDGDYNDEFEFEIQLDRNHTSLSYYGIDGKSDGVIPLINNKGTFKLKAGESIMLMDIEEMTNYKIIELNNEELLYNVEYENNIGTVERETQNKVLVKNSRNYGDLKIEKKITGTDALPSMEYQLAISLSTPGATHSYIGLGTIPDGELTLNSNGEAFIKLKGGDGIVIKDILEGTEYQVMSNDYSHLGFETTHVNNQGNITKNESSDVLVVNHRDIEYGELEISKKVKRNNHEDAEFMFNIHIDNGKGNYEYEGAGGKEDGSIILDSNGDGIFALRDGESITFKNFVSESKYTIKEYDYTKENYTTIHENDQGVISKDRKMSVKITNTFIGDKKVVVLPNTSVPIVSYSMLLLAIVVGLKLIIYSKISL